MNLILLHAADRLENSLFRLTGRRVKHVREVLRAAPGDTLAAGEFGGKVGFAIVRKVDADAVDLEATFDREPPPPPGIDLLLALPRPKVLRRLVASVTSLGVKRIILVNAARVEKSYFDSPLLAPEELAAEVVLGLEQARDTIPPEITIHRGFKPFVEDRLASIWPADVRKLLAHPLGSDDPESVDVGTPRERAVVAIGPEGGWVPYEVDLLRAQGFTLIALGPRILRVETAVPFVLGQLELARRVRSR